jgi:tRNA-specific 2-thiouridylase
VDSSGDTLGYHKGIAFYTIGQRQGLGIARGHPLYITQISPKNNTITVGGRREVLKSEFLVKSPHFILKPLKKKIAVGVRIRYNHKEEPAQVMPFNRKIKVRFRKPQFAVTPGQSAVFYDGDIVLGGGIIDEVL